MVERFKNLLEKRLLVYAVALLLLAGYFLILFSAPEISNEITVRSFVAIFALVCMALWIPSYKSDVDFNMVSLIHFKGIFTSLLYSGVIAAGTSAIIAAIDTLLFDVHSDAYLYTMAVIWILFAPVYYLSLLPKFNSELNEDKEMAERASNYPKFLEILVSYIAIPLISAYTAVLMVYFLKILFTLTWPSGQIGPMVLVYSIAGLVIFILASLLDNRFAAFYRKFFPRILIFVVIMQLISVGIRLYHYGITEARYYVGIFGIFSVIAGILLTRSPVSKNGRIALLVAVFAIVSIIPPVDAFTVSRHSQINRIESILANEGMLVNGDITKKEDASEYTRIETTNILNYLDRTSSLQYIPWLPEDFAVYEDLKQVFGFAPTYPNYIDGSRQYFYVSLDGEKPLPIAGYDILLNAFVGTYDEEREISSQDFELDGSLYKMNIDGMGSNGVYLSILDSLGNELIGTDLNQFIEEIASEEPVIKDVLSPDELSFAVSNNGYELKIIFQNINYSSVDGIVSDMNYSIYVLFANAD